MQIKSELNQIPKEEAHIELSLKTHSASYEDQKKTALQIEVKRKEVDNQITAKKTQISKYQTQQMQTKKNDEYQALGHEIERSKQQISEMEDHELQLMEDYESAQKQLEAESIKVKEYETATQTRRQALKEKKKNLEAELERLNTEITSAESHCAPAEMKTYRRILASKGDRAIVKIEGENMCGGCHMALTHQQILSAKGGKIANCANCGRILFWQNEFA